MENFKEWLIEEELRELSLNEGLPKKWAALPLTLATMLPMSTIKGDKPSSPHPIVVQENELMLQKLANKLNKIYGTDLQASNFRMYRPSDLIRQSYGDKYQDVVKRAALAQQPQKLSLGDIGDVEIPDTSAATMNVDKLDQPIPVIFTDPVTLGAKSNMTGFCNRITIGGKEQAFCVVNSPENLDTLRHELSHTTQPLYQMDYSGSDLSLGGKGFFGKYFMNKFELGVRLADMKRSYYQLTGKIVTSDRESFRQAIQHLMANKDKYGEDSQQLVFVIEEANKRGLLEKLLNFLQENIDKVVVNQKSTTIG